MLINGLELISTFVLPILNYLLKYNIEKKIPAGKTVSQERKMMII